MFALGPNRELNLQRFAIRFVYFSYADEGRSLNSPATGGERKTRATRLSENGSSLFHRKRYIIRANGQSLVQPYYKTKLLCISPCQVSLSTRIHFLFYKSWFVRKKPHSSGGRDCRALFFYFQEVLKKIISDPPATASLRWLLIYRIDQQKYTWRFVSFESIPHETKLCEGAVQ